jgi:hypothetical protein
VVYTQQIGEQTMKKILLLLFCLVCYEKVVYGQIEFIDFASIGAGYSNHYSNDSEFCFLADYSIGSLFHKIDLAALVNVRTNISDTMLGGQFDYFGFNIFGFGLSSGAIINKEKNWLAYIRASIFSHLISTMKLTMDFEYRSDSTWSSGILLSIPLVSNYYRGNNVQYSHLRTNKNIVGKWKCGDKNKGIFLELKTDQTFEYIKYHNGEIIEKRLGYFSTGKIFKYNGMRLVYTDRKTNEGFGFEYELDDNSLGIEIDGERIYLIKTEK